MSDEEFDVSKYTDEQLFRILNLLPNPTDRELEAQILSMIRKYSQYGNATGDKLAQFYIDIYTHFFETDAPPETTYDTQPTTQTTPANISADGRVDSSSMTVTKKAVLNSGEEDVQLTKPIDYTKDKLNPLLKQSIKRIVSIDSQYREDKSGLSTQFTFNLSEPLRDVVALSLYSVQIPYTWYTINGNYGGNFIYIKGLSPGINDGNHDYKIQIPSGNYTPDGLVARVNESIQRMAALNTDVSFGQTSVIFNDGISSSVGGTGKAKFLVDITNVYGEGNYYLKFPNWTSPVVIVGENGMIQTERFKSIAGYLGFNSDTHRTTGIYSAYLTGYSTANENAEFILTPDNSYFDIIPYIGASYLSADPSSIYDAIRISLWNPTNEASSILYMREQLIELLDTTLKKNTQLDPDYSECSWVDISGVDQYNSGNSYIQIHCKLNKKTAPIVQKLKLAVRFPAVPPSEVSIFTGDSSCFKIITNLVDSSQNPIYELNTILADTSVLQSNYQITDTYEHMIQFNCITYGYDLPANHYTVKLAPSTNGYNLQEYIAQINTSIQAVNGLVGTGTGTTTTRMYIGGADNYVYLQTYIRKQFETASYQIKGTGIIKDIFGLSSGFKDLSSQNVFSNEYGLTSVYFTSSDTIIIKPNPNEVGLNLSNEYVIDFSGSATYYNPYNMVQFLNGKIQSWIDPNRGTRPLANSKAEFDGKYFILTVNVQNTLTQNDYNVSFVGNSWSEHLQFDVSNPYVLSSPSYNKGTYSLFANNTPKTDNQITLQDNLNNYFTVFPYENISGLQTTNDQYAFRVTIPGGTYSVVSLLDTINKKLDESTIAKGSRFETVTINGQLYVQMRWNINQVFTTKDYQLVFYDPVSFVNCYIGSKSVQNATWDTTLGWILGFRNQITYNLRDYVQNLYSYETTDLEYYLTGTDSNVFTLIGDTAVSTNLYNYFMIVLDDYVQNHLNDGLVTITSQETVINHAPAIFVCDPATGQQIARPADYGSPGVYYTDKQLYSFNQQVQSNAIKSKSYSKGPFVQDVFGIIPIKPGTINSTYIEFGGTLQNQQRVYFGPVNIHRMTIRLLNDRGDLVDLNNANWGFSLICEQLYKNS